jgi:hypothetical protein
VANDEKLAVCVSGLEVQVAAVAAGVAEIRANYVTKACLDERLSALKTELLAYIDARMEKMARTCVTKDDLREMEQRIYRWGTAMFIKMFLGLLIAQTGLQLAMLQLYLHIK